MPSPACLPSHLTDWAGASAVWMLIALSGLACFGFYASRAGQPLLGTLGTSGMFGMFGRSTLGD
jgi:hypothetical protein